MLDHAFTFVSIAPIFCNSLFSPHEKIGKPEGQLGKEKKESGRNAEADQEGIDAAIDHTKRHP